MKFTDLKPVVWERISVSAKHIAQLPAIWISPTMVRTTAQNNLMHSFKHCVYKQIIHAITKQQYNSQTKSSLLWDFTQISVWDSLSVPYSLFSDCLSVEGGPKGCPKMLISNYHWKLHNIPEKQRFNTSVQAGYNATVKLIPWSTVSSLRRQ
jgi:hypothetical protein